MFVTSGQASLAPWWHHRSTLILAIAVSGTLLLRGTAASPDEQSGLPRFAGDEEALPHGMCSVAVPGGVPPTASFILSRKEEAADITSSIFLQREAAGRTHKVASAAAATSTAHIASVSLAQDVAAIGAGGRLVPLLTRGVTSVVNFLQIAKGRTVAAVSKHGMGAGSALRDVATGLEVGIWLVVAGCLGAISCWLLCSPPELQGEMLFGVASSAPSATMAPSKGPPSMLRMQLPPSAGGAAPRAALPTVQSLPCLPPRSLPESKQHLKPVLGGSGPGDTSHQVFCPDLVVPSGCECVLVVPLRRAAERSLDLTDMNGNVVLRAVLSAEPDCDSNHGGDMLYENLQQVVLTSNQGVALARCHMTETGSTSRRSLRMVHGDSQMREFHLFRAQGDYFGKVTRSVERNAKFCLVTVSGTPLYFRGSQEHRAWSITDGAGKLVAATELCLVEFDYSRQFFRMRVAPLQDMGLILCSVLCIELLNCPDDTAPTNRRSATPPPSTRCSGCTNDALVTRQHHGPLAVALPP